MFRVASTEQERQAAYSIRSIVFIAEQACPFAEEFDGLDADAIHIVGMDQGEPVAAARIRRVGDWAKFERIALLPRVRGQGHGHDLVEFMLSVARDAGFRRFKMHAQSHLESFYGEHGFERQGEPFDEVGLEHLLMTRDDGPAS